jgi:gamma-glutamyltranspeptidase / glutathione hydrolase
MLKNSIFLVSLSLILLCSPIAASAKKGHSGAVASGHPLATKAGLDVLKKGGNAFDAAVAVASTLNVVEPALSGLGGYGSTVVYDATKKEIRYLNSSGKFPKKTNSDLMRAPTVDYMNNRKGPKSISTPGNLNAWKEMHAKYGKMPWANLFEHAIFYAKNGFPVSPYIAKVIASSFNEFSDYSKSFYGRDGRPLKEGEILVQKDLAKTYELIASEGVKPFYSGSIALQIDNQMKERGSFLSIEDLRADVAEWWDPIKINYKGYDVYTMGTPGNGFSALFALGVLEQFNLQKLKHNSPEYLHLLAEVLKESSKVRLTHSGTVEEKDNIENHILTPVNFAQVAKSIDTKKASHFDLHSGKEGLNTTHFVVVDKWGNIVTSTQTLGRGFGSKVMIEGTGVWMNNSMAFSTWEPKGNPMDAFPGQYKLSSNSPIIIMKNGLPWAALGTPGGHTIPQNVAQIVVNLIDFNMNMQKAIDAPKLAFFDEDNVIVTENDIPASVVSALKKKGHNIDNEHRTSYIGPNGKIGNAMGVKILHNQDDISFDIGVDKRRDGWSTTHIAPAKK